MAFLSEYKRRQKITIEASAHLSGDLTDQTIVIHIDSGNTDFWLNDDGDGTYVRFTSSDGFTLLKFEVESYDNSGDDAWWHVQIPTLLSASDTDIYIYYNADSPSDGSDKESTWDSNFKGVWHLNQDKAEGAFDDSTSNNNDGTNSGTIDAAGLVDRGRSFDDIDDYINIGDKASLDFGISDFSGSAVIDLNVGEAVGIIFGKWTGQVSDPGWYFYIAGAGNLFFRMSDGTTAIATPSPGVDIRGALHTVGFIVDRSGNVQLYLDGSTLGSGVNISSVGSVSNSLDFVIGSSATKVSAHTLYGVEDETEVSNTLRTPDYMAARHQSNLGNWLTFGEREIFATRHDLSTSTYDKNFNAFSELNNKNTII